MRMLVLLALFLFAAALVMWRNAPRCDAADRDGTRIGGMLIAGCDRRR